MAYDRLIDGKKGTKAGLIEFGEADRVREEMNLEAGLSNREVTIVRG